MTASASADRTDPPASLPAPRHENLELIAALRDELQEVHFTNDGVAELLGTEAVAALDREQPVPGQLHVQQLLSQGPISASGQHAAAEKLPSAAKAVPNAAEASRPEPSAEVPSAQVASGAGPAPTQYRCAVLSALWLLDVPVTAEQIDAALPGTGVHGLLALGLIRQQGQQVFPTVDLRPYQVQARAGMLDLWVLSDLAAHQREHALPHDHVLGIGQASLTLAGATHRAPVSSALDLGTGCGIQLLHLLDHAEHVVGTDISQRALDFARFNLLLNAPALGLAPERLEDRVELRLGSLLEPVAGRQFDLIVSNPPFVITPRTTGVGEEAAEAQRYVYRDGGREGDTLMAELIAALPEALTPAGTAQMLGNWEIQQPSMAPAADGEMPEHSGAEESDWMTRPRRWVEEARLEAWIIQRDQQSPAEYAEMWLRDASEERDVEDYRRRYADYLRDFASRSVTAVGFGMLWLRRPEASAAQRSDLWRRFEELAGPIQQPVGPLIGETVQRAQMIAADVPGVLNKHLSPAPDVTEERFQRFGAEHPEVILARQGAGLRRTRALSSAAAGFLAAADGDFDAAALITAVCSLTETEEEMLAQEVLELYLEGYLH